MLLPKCAGIGHQNILGSDFKFKLNLLDRLEKPRCKTIILKEEEYLDGADDYLCFKLL